MTLWHKSAKNTTVYRYTCVSSSRLRLTTAAAAAAVTAVIAKNTTFKHSFLQQTAKKCHEKKYNYLDIL